MLLFLNTSKIIPKLFSLSISLRSIIKEEKSNFANFRITRHLKAYSSLINYLIIIFLISRLNYVQSLSQTVEFGAGIFDSIDSSRDIVHSYTFKVSTHPSNYN